MPIPIPNRLSRTGYEQSNNGRVIGVIAVAVAEVFSNDMIIFRNYFKKCCAIFIENEN